MTDKTSIDEREVNSLALLLPLRSFGGRGIYDTFPEESRVFNIGVQGSMSNCWELREIESLHDKSHQGVANSYTLHFCLQHYTPEAGLPLHNMLLLAALRNLPVSLFISSLALASSALPVHTIALTPENFHQSVSEGVWFIEHFSPYCSHCRDFAPTWAKLVEENESDVQMAQVNCAVHGGASCNQSHNETNPPRQTYVRRTA